MKNLFAILVFMLASFVLITASRSNEIQEEQSVQLPTGATLKYVESGDRSGTTLILLHGFTDSWRSYEKVLPLFPGKYHTIAISQRGHGNSSKSHPGYAMKDFAADIAAFIKIKKLGACIIVGHSMGGVIAQQFALDHPGLTRAVVIISSDASFADNPGLPEFREEIKKLSDPVDYSFAEAFQKSTIAKPVDSAFIKQCIDESMKVPADGWKKIIDEILAVDFTDQLEKINVPVLILWGSKDAICSLDDQKLMKEKIKKSTLLVYDGTGHALHWEDPDRFVADLVDFINNISQQPLASAPTGVGIA